MQKARLPAKGLGPPRPLAVPAWNRGPSGGPRGTAANTEPNDDAIGGPATIRADRMWTVQRRMARCVGRCDIISDFVSHETVYQQPTCCAGNQRGWWGPYGDPTCDGSASSNSAALTTRIPPCRAKLPEIAVAVSAHCRSKGARAVGSGKSVTHGDRGSSLWRTELMARSARPPVAQPARRLPSSGSGFVPTRSACARQPDPAERRLVRRSGGKPPYQPTVR